MAAPLNEESRTASSTSSASSAYSGAEGQQQQQQGQINTTNVDDDASSDETRAPTPTNEDAKGKTSRKDSSKGESKKEGETETETTLESYARQLKVSLSFLRSSFSPFGAAIGRLLQRIGALVCGRIGSGSKQGIITDPILHKSENKSLWHLEDSTQPSPSSPSLGLISLYAVSADLGTSIQACDVELSSDRSLTAAMFSTPTPWARFFRELRRIPVLLLKLTSLRVNSGPFGAMADKKRAKKLGHAKAEHDRDEGMTNEKVEDQEEKGGKGKGGKKGTGLGKGERYLIRDFSGVVKSGEMMLVVVSPSPS